MPEKKTNPDGPDAFSFGAIQENRPCVLLGVSGGIAAYKVVDLASKLTALGAAVKTVMTEHACQFVGAKSFEAVTCSAVFTSMWSSPEDHQSTHIALVDWADIVVAAPATANIIGKAANGICDDLLSTMLCAASHKPILLAPAMNSNMWANPAVQRNVLTLKEAGTQLIGPVEGRLANGAVGMGRMAEPRDILAAIDKMLQK
ncbi:MAG: phosphopantothenoylcysteine decarboxylase [Planctomycetes bacterium]|nr:phosphopantothenoylcysteine decarboxylase [Planctomycetota bacterium]